MKCLEESCGLQEASLHVNKANHGSKLRERSRSPPGAREAGESEYRSPL